MLSSPLGGGGGRDPWHHPPHWLGGGHQGRKARLGESNRGRSMGGALEGCGDERRVRRRRDGEGAHAMEETRGEKRSRRHHE